MRPPVQFVLITVGLFVATSSLRAQPLVAHTRSLEAALANADLVLIVTLESMGEAKNVNGHESFPTTVSVEQTLKQDLFTVEPYRRVQIDLPGDEQTLSKHLEQSARLLVAYDELAPLNTTVIDLSPSNVEVFTAEGRLLRDPKDVIQVAREFLRRQPAPIKRLHTLGWALPRDKYAETQWGKFHGLILEVPVDEQLEEKALRAIKSTLYHDRETAARALRYFKSESNIALMRRLLTDPGWAIRRHAQENDGVEVRYLGVRQAAYEALTVWGIQVEAPETIEEVPTSTK